VLQLAQRFSEPRLGEGFDALWQAADATTRATLGTDAPFTLLVTAGVTPELDAALRALPADKLAEMATHLAALIAAGDADGVRELAARVPD